MRSDWSNANWFEVEKGVWIRFWQTTLWGVLMNRGKLQKTSGIVEGFLDWSFGPGCASLYATRKWISWLLVSIPHDKPEERARRKRALALLSLAMVSRCKAGVAWCQIYCAKTIVFFFHLIYWNRTKDDFCSINFIVGKPIRKLPLWCCSWLLDQKRGEEKFLIFFGFKWYWVARSHLNNIMLLGYV